MYPRDLHKWPVNIFSYSHEESQSPTAQLKSLSREPVQPWEMNTVQYPFHFEFVEDNRQNASPWKLAATRDNPLTCFASIREVKSQWRETEMETTMCFGWMEVLIAVWGLPETVLLWEQRLVESSEIETPDWPNTANSNTSSYCIWAASRNWP